MNNCKNKHSKQFGSIYIAVGILILGIHYYMSDKISDMLRGMLVGLGFTLSIAGILMIIRTLYYKQPKNADKYVDMLEMEEIDIQDELKEKVRDKTGRMFYRVNIVITIIVTITNVILDNFGIAINNVTLSICLSVYLAFQLIFGSVYYKRLLKKY